MNGFTEKNKQIEIDQEIVNSAIECTPENWNHFRLDVGKITKTEDEVSM